MRKDIIINSNPHEIRIGILEDGDLVEMFIERADAKRIVGNVYMGKVTSVKPGLQAAFVDIGLERAGFLHASDLVHEDPEDDDDVDGPAPRGRSRNAREVPDIGKTLKVGDHVLVQVTKEPISSKGPRLTADISLPGRFLVHMPKGRHVGVSRKIEERQERARLKQILTDCRPEEGAFIIRTAAAGAEDSAIRNDVKYLSDLWRQIADATDETVAPALVHEDVGMVVGLIRDIFKEDVNELVIDDKDDYDRLLKYVKIFAPALKPRIRLYRENQAIFDRYGIEQELRKSTENRVWLKKGGYIIIEQTEAMVSVDVNTGRFTGKRNQEDTITETNLYAAKEVARQLRLRDIGGIIVVDFIDMESEGNKKRVERELTNALKRDRARTKVFPISKLGLIEMSRQRVRPSLVSFLSDDCPYCKGVGKVLSLPTLANRVEREVHRVFHRTGEKVVQIRCNPMLAMFLLREKADQIEELCEEHGMSIDILDDPALHRESFQVVSQRTDRDLLKEIDKDSGAPRPRGRGNRHRPSATTSPSRGAASPSASPKRPPQPERVRERIARDDSQGSEPQRREPRSEPRAESRGEPRSEPRREPRTDPRTEPRGDEERTGGVVGSPRGRTRTGRQRGRRGGRGRGGGAEGGPSQGGGSQGGGSDGGGTSTA